MQTTDYEDVIAICNFFIKKHSDKHMYLGAMKLQKLLYFSQGWHMALYNSILFNNAFEAWEYGPVIPYVYEKFIQYDTKTINELSTSIILKNNTWIIGIPKLKNQILIEPFLDKIFDTYGILTGDDLGNFVKYIDTPWTKTRSLYNNPKGISHIVIPDDLTYMYFNKLIKI